MIEKATLKGADDFERQKNQIITDYRHITINIDEHPRSYPCLMAWYVEERDDYSTFKYDFVYVTEFAGLPVKFDGDDVPFNLTSAGPAPEGGGFDVVIEPDPEKGRTLCKIFAMHLLSQLDWAKAKNYLEIQVRDDQGRGVVVTVKHQFGDSPAQVLKRVEEDMWRLARHVEASIHDAELGAKAEKLLEELRAKDPAKYEAMVTHFGEYEVH